MVQMVQFARITIVSDSIIHHTSGASMNPTTGHSHFRVVALLVICLLPSVATAQIPQFDCFYVFGDSLADNGNIWIQTSAMGMEPAVPPSVTPHRTYFQEVLERLRRSRIPMAASVGSSARVGSRVEAVFGVTLYTGRMRDQLRLWGDRNSVCRSNAGGILLAWPERPGRTLSMGAGARTILDSCPVRGLNRLERLPR